MPCRHLPLPKSLVMSIPMAVCRRARVLCGGDVGRREARLSVFELVEEFYDPDRLHSALDYQLPVDYQKEDL